MSQKLAAIQAFALAQHQALDPHFTAKGGCLLLGRYYAESPKIFFGLNPGLLQGRHKYAFDVDPVGETLYNPPFHNWPNHGIRYWRNCENKFLGLSRELNAWFNDHMTSSFLVPWRTQSVRELYTLNENTSGELFARSGQIIIKMIGDHDANVLVVAGKKAPQLLSDVLVARGVETSSVIAEDGYHGEGLYQYSEWSFCIGSRGLTVFQVPHFSRANSSQRLLPCAQWLIRKLRLQVR